MADPCCPGTVIRVRKSHALLLLCSLLVGCGPQEHHTSPRPSTSVTLPAPDVTRVPENPTAVLTSLYQPVLEPFTATFTYTRYTSDEKTGSEVSYAAIKTTVVQDSALDISVTESGRWDTGADHVLVDGVLYVRTRPFPADWTPLDVEGIDTGQWVPYYDFLTLASDAAGFRVSEDTVVLDRESLAPGVTPQRPYLARAPLAIMQGEQFGPPPASCVEFLTGLPKNNVTRLDKYRWRIKCETGLAVVESFIAEFDSSGRLTRFHNDSDAYLSYDLTVSYAQVSDIEKPDTAWWEKNQALVHQRVKRLAKSTRKPQ